MTLVEPSRPEAGADLVDGEARELLGVVPIRPFRAGRAETVSILADLGEPGLVAARLLADGVENEEPDSFRIFAESLGEGGRWTLSGEREPRVEAVQRESAAEVFGAAQSRSGRDEPAMRLIVASLLDEDALVRVAAAGALLRVDSKNPLAEGILDAEGRDRSSEIGELARAVRVNARGYDDRRIEVEPLRPRPSADTSGFDSALIHGTWARRGRWWQPSGDLHQFLRAAAVATREVARAARAVGSDPSNGVGEHCQRDPGEVGLVSRSLPGGRTRGQAILGGLVRDLEGGTCPPRLGVGELAAMRFLDVASLSRPEEHGATVRDIAERWRRSRVDVSEGTAATYAVNLGRILPRIGHLPIDQLTADRVAGLVAELHGEGLARESIRKTISTLAQVVDAAKIVPNPARDRDVRLPRGEIEEIDPPIADRVERVYRLLASRYRLPLLVLDATGMRITELERLTWGDLDEPGGRWRVRTSSSKTRRPRWVGPLPDDLFTAVVEIVPRDDRIGTEQVFEGFGADRFRTQLTRSCKAAGVPHMSPHQLRHRRATLWHLSGVPVVEASAWLGHSPTEHLKTYAHATIEDRTEIDYRALLAEFDARVAVHPRSTV